MDDEGVDAYNDRDGLLLVEQNNRPRKNLDSVGQHCWSRK